MVVRDCRQMLTIGLTGGIGAGKSEVARILEGLGAVVIDADRLGHAVYRSGAPGFAEVVGAFGEEVVGADGEIDRRRLGRLVFENPGRRRELEGIVWPRIREALEARIGFEREKGSAEVLVVEAARLFEACWDSLLDEVWVVVAPEGEVVRRLTRDREMPEEDVLGRIRAQTAGPQPKGRASATIRNDCGLTELTTAVESLWRERIRGKA